MVQLSSLLICNGKVIENNENNLKPSIFINCEGLIISPGFIDIQLNGAFGIDFTQICTENYEIFEEENIKKILFVKNKLLQFGVTSFCPTIISSQQNVYYNCLKLIEKIKTLNNEYYGAQIIGAHFEGPFINPKRAGCHPIELILPFNNNNKQIDLFYSNSFINLISNLSIVTLAPELENSENAIKILVNKDIRVCIGHSNAELRIAEEALINGVTGITHLFCAMPGFHHRTPGIIDLLLLTTNNSNKFNKQIYYSIIADNIHLSESSIQLAYSLNPNGVMLVTDGISALEKKATVDGTDILAGSVASMLDCIKHFSSCIEKRFKNKGLTASLKAATFTPANFLGIQKQKGTLIAGSDADFVLIDERKMEIIATFIKGIKCFDSLIK